MLIGRMYYTVVVTWTKGDRRKEGEYDFSGRTNYSTVTM